MGLPESWYLCQSSRIDWATLNKWAAFAPTTNKQILNVLWDILQKNMKAYPEQYPNIPDPPLFYEKNWFQQQIQQIKATLCSEIFLAKKGEGKGLTGESTWHDLQHYVSIIESEADHQFTRQFRKWIFLEDLFSQFTNRPQV